LIFNQNFKLKFFRKKAIIKILSFCEKYCSLALVDGVARVSNGESIFVANSERMKTKVLQLARYTTQPAFILTSARFPRLKDELLLDGPGVGPDNEMYIYNETRIFYRFQKLTKKFFDKSDGKDFDVEMKFRVGSKHDVVYTKTFKLSEAQDMRKFYKIKHFSIPYVKEFFRRYFIKK